MKEALIKYPHHRAECWMIMLSSVEDFKEYSEMAAKQCNAFISKVMKSDIPVNRWDHIWDQSAEGAIFSAMVHKCKILGGTPLIEYSKLFDEKMKNILFQLIAGKTVVTNSVGGWMPLIDGFEILDTREYQEKVPDTHIINKNTKYINLENDPKLEEHAMSYLIKQDENYSYILNLRGYSKEQLIEVLKEFKLNGGEVVYVYTTGMDIDQMYEYSETAIEAGIDYFEFEFSSETTENHEEFITWLGNRKEVEIL